MSGGIDSAVCLALEVKAGRRVLPLFINYGQAQYSSEKAAVVGLLAHYQGLEEMWDLMNIPGLGREGDEYILRNMILATYGASYAYAGGYNRIIMGIKDGVFTDTTPLFVDIIGALIWNMTHCKVRFYCPLLLFDKARTVEEARKLGVPLELTYSCQRSNTPCGECGSCKERAKLGI